MEEASPFQTHEYQRRRFDRIGRKLAFTAETPQAWRRWRQRTIRKLRELIGYDTFQAAPLRAKITEEVEHDGCRRQRVEIQTEPGVFMPLYVLIPAGASGRLPAVIAPHGHSSGGKLAVAGCREMVEVSRTIDEHNYAYGLQFARAGFITFCPDARGFGERQEAAMKGNILASSCHMLNARAFPLGQTVTGMWTWDLHRLIDYVQSRKDCDANRIGCAGLSGGGLQTLWTTALDGRIKCAVISGYMYGFKQSLLDLVCCWCNYVPHLYEHVDMGDIAALIAPRPLLIETGTRDNLNGAGGLRNVRSQVSIIRRAYRLLGAGGMLKHDVFDGPHMWRGVEAVPWMQRHLGQ